MDTEVKCNFSQKRKKVSIAEGIFGIIEMNEE